MTDRSRQPRGRSRFLSNTVALVLQTIFATLITLGQVKILANFLSKETFGLFASLRGFSLLLAMLAANGLPQLLVRFIPVLESNRQRRRALRLIVFCVVASSVLLALLGLIVYGLRFRFLGFASAAFGTSDLFFWFSVTTFGVMLKLILYGGLNGLRRLTIQVLIETVSLVAMLLWIVIEREQLTLSLLFKILGSVHLATVFVGMPAFVAALVKSTGAGEERGDANGGSTRGEYQSYLFWAAGLSFVALAFTDVDRYLLAQVISLELLALFHIGARISRLANRLLGVSSLAFQPEVTRLDSEGRSAGILFSTRIFLKLNTALAVLVAVLLAWLAEEIITVVASADYVAAVPLLIILAGSLPLTTATAPVTAVMKALNQVRGALVADLAWALAYVSLLFALGRMYGLIGVGVAQLCACAVQLVVAMRISKLPLGAGFVGAVFAKLMIGSVAAFLPFILIGHFILGASLVVNLCTKTALFLVGCVAFRYIVGAMGFFADDEREALRGILRARGLDKVGRVLCP